MTEEGKINSCMSQVVRSSDKYFGKFNGRKRSYSNYNGKNNSGYKKDYEPQAMRSKSYR